MNNNLNKPLTTGQSANSGGINADFLDRLLEVASKKLGCTPETLRKNLESGEFENAVKNSQNNNPQFNKLKQAISDPKAAEQMLKNPAAEQMLKKLNIK